MSSTSHRLTLALALLLAGLTGAPAQEHPVFNTKVEPPQAPILREMLQKGGFVIFLRHGTTPDYQEPSPTDFTSCERQRNLNGIGRGQAAMIRQPFRALNIAAAAGLARPYRRTLDNAPPCFC